MIKKEKQLFLLVSSAVALLQAEVFTESKVRGQLRFNTLVQAKALVLGVLERLQHVYFLLFLLLSGTRLPVVDSAHGCRLVCLLCPT